MGLFRSLAIGLLVLAVPLTLVTTNVRFAASEHRVYDYSIRHYDAEEITGIPEGELLEANRKLIKYFTSENPGPLQIEVQGHDGETVSLFNARETAHLADVRDLFRLVFEVQVVSLAIALVLGVLLLVWLPMRALAAATLLGSLITIGLIFGVGLIALTGFDAAWRDFHLIAFTDDLWKLNPRTDHLIQMFPEPFWRDVTLLVGSLSIVESLVIATVSLAYLLRTRPKSEAGPAPAERPSMPRPPRDTSRRPLPR